MVRLTMRLLGPPLVELDGQAVQLGRHKALALLAYLALTGQPHSRDALATLLWPELDQRGARGQLRRTLSLLNRTLGNPWLSVDRETVSWAPGSGAWIDVAVLHERLTGCAAHGHPAQETCAQCVPLLDEAVALYQDGFLAGFTLPDAPAFDEWQFFETEGLRDRVADALQRLARWHGGRGEHETAIPYARRRLALGPLHEPAHRELMVLYARSGQRAAALRQYAECERILGQELSLAPSPETTALYEAVRAGRELPSAAPAERAVPAEPASRRQHNLPAQLTPFVGRVRELEELARLLDPEADVRLVTVTGPGGMGKTRLALEAAAREVDRYADGVWFVPLAAVQTAEGITSATAQAVGASFLGGEPPDRQLLRYLRDKRVLLVLDNLEDLLEGAGLVIELLHAAPGVRVLVTSRVRLNVSGEQVYILGGMGYPDSPAPEAVRRSSATALFVQGARRAQAGFQLDEVDLPHVARICRLAQGMPLALLLAAAWVPALTLSEIATEMERGLEILAAEWRDEPERHHSVRAAFDATWGMLTEGERQAFARLSVFRGGFTRQAAQAVAGAGPRMLLALVHKSLLQRDVDGRYEIHELLRQYGADKLDEQPAERERALDLHAAYYTEFLVSKEMELDRSILGEPMHEIDNIRAAWRRATAQGRRREIHRSMILLFGLCQGPGLLREGEALFAAAVCALRAQATELPVEDGQAALGLALTMQAHFAQYSSADRAAELAREGLSLLRGLGARREVAAGYTLAAMYARLGPAATRQLYEESLALSEELGCRLVIDNRIPLAGLALERGDSKEAERYLGEALAAARRTDDRANIALALANLGNIAYERGEFAAARERYMESLALFQEVGIEWAVGRLHSLLGNTAMATGDPAAARAWHQRALASYQQIGVDWQAGPVVLGGSWGVPVALQRMGDASLAAGDPDQARHDYSEALRQAIDRPYPELHRHLLLGPARWLAHVGDAARAVELAALALHSPESVDETRQNAEDLLRELQPQLSPDVYAAALDRGQARDPDATLRDLLAELEGPPESGWPRARQPARVSRLSV
jgi:predicted ATPase/DNA-binding SARP family transcriptional activator/predicted negative regulator of RcsB-dependent stress response